MKKALKIARKIVLGILILMAVFLTALTVYNQIMLQKNKALYETPLGELVEVDGHSMSIYTAGEGDHTIVFLSGWGTPSPILDFKALYSRLSDDYKIVVIEKFGYGFSDEIDGKRDFDTILRQDREALEKVGIEDPYVLCAHSLSGYEAVLWAQKYPDEVEGIVGLDMCTPNCETEDAIRSNAKLISTTKPVSRACLYMGLFRFENMDFSGTLSDEEKKIYTEIICHKAINDTLMNEREPDNQIAINNELNSAPLPTVPMIMYISADNKDDKLWEGGMQAMVDASTDGKLMKLDCGHYVHDFEYERISKDMKEFIEGLEK